MLSDEQMNALIGVKIKIKPNRGDKKKGGLTVAVLRRFDNKYAYVVPASHRNIEKVPRDCVIFWKKGLRLNQKRYQEVVHLFEPITQPTKIESKSPLMVPVKKIPVVSEQKMSKQSKGKLSTGEKYVIACPKLQLFWCGREKGFSYAVDEALVYDNTTGPRVAIKLLDKARKDGRPRWEHILADADFQVMHIGNSFYKMLKEWQKTCPDQVFRDHSVLHKPYYLYETRVRDNCKKTAEDLTKKIEETISPKEEEKPMDAAEATPATPKLEVVTPSLKEKIDDALEKYATARRQMTEIEALLAEAHREVETAEAELDILKKHKEMGRE